MNGHKESLKNLPQRHQDTNFHKNLLVYLGVFVALWQVFLFSIEFCKASYKFQLINIAFLIANCLPRSFDYV